MVFKSGVFGLSVNPIQSRRRKRGKLMPTTFINCPPPQIFGSSTAYLCKYNCRKTTNISGPAKLGVQVNPRPCPFKKILYHFVCRHIFRPSDGTALLTAYPFKNDSTLCAIWLCLARTVKSALLQYLIVRLLIYEFPDIYNFLS